MRRGLNQVQLLFLLNYLVCLERVAGQTLYLMLLCDSDSDCTAASCGVRCGYSIFPNGASYNVCRNADSSSCDGLNTAQCPAGQYKTYPGQMYPNSPFFLYDCVNCPAGKFRDPAIAGTTQDSCSQCPTGKYSYAGSGSCSSCGSYYDPTPDQTACVLCPAGKFATSTGCSPCIPGYYRTATDILYFG